MTCRRHPLSTTSSPGRATHGDPPVLVVRPVPARSASDTAAGETHGAVCARATAPVAAANAPVMTSNLVSDAGVCKRNLGLVAHGVLLADVTENRP